MTGRDGRQTRRKITLETLSFAVPVTAAVLCSGLVVATWSRDDALLAALLTAVACTAVMLWHRSNHPASIAPRSSSAAEAEASAGTDDVEDEGGRWDVLTVVLFVASLTAVVVVGVVVRFTPALAVIVLFAVADSDSDLGDVALATVLTLGAAAVVELVVVAPLSRLWDLSTDEGPGLLASIYPVATDRA
ncbi:hypothetical protein [Aeromicrobium sp. Root472D3]|uniref:hypothetical protein n=1 Tax=Aeromicrobium sp. Root472D3 TaxID=1736540 RepID=UPI0006F78A36|nr:hypothetical protein [Aeromicrobium sp. Root472D3]KQX74258.1 hypothetical protein ASD10_03150 [Aeromicrobium sp. Root472D3]